MQTPQERRKAQRLLAKNLKEGKPTLPKSITAPIKRAGRSKEQIIRDIIREKNARFGGRPKFNQRRSDKNVAIDPESGQARSINELRKIDSVLRRAKLHDDFSAIYYDLASDESDLESALYYK